MTDQPPAPADPQPLPRRRLGPALWRFPLAVAGVLALIVVIELVLQASDRGWIGTLRWRSLAYQYGAFWPGLLGNWTPNFAAQSLTMFATYALLHADMGHMAGNALTIVGLGQIACQRAGQRGFLIIYATSAVGGALCFALLSRSPQPMVGASGALFGLAGAWTWWLWRDCALLRHGGLQVLGVIVLLVVLNLVVWISLDGLLAWQTHLGGFLAGAATAWALPDRLAPAGAQNRRI
ncbi:rhomboid family intramembrane serine protease [Loktanella sp. DJP18]|uniref:rhomboid family intramembrane serine protease n=1 Tax=Loktanella sp. DJP18 TaxID=3409788 RepID=UPI003BB70CCA